MPSPEGQGGLLQLGEHSKEQEQIPYYLAAWFHGEPSAKRVYFQAQELVSGDKQADLSLHGFLLNQISHVAVLGEQPPEDLDRQLRALLSTGETVLLPSDFLNALHERRKKMKQHGF